MLKNKYIFYLLSFNLLCLQPTILYIIDSKPNLTGSTICGVILESKSCPLINDQFNWVINIDSGPPKLIDVDESEEIINILQITDIHYDPNYEPYGNAYCDEPVCCRRGQNDTNTSNEVAGYWGDYNQCDSPWHAVVDVLEQIRDTHEVCRKKSVLYIMCNSCQKCIIVLNLNPQNISYVYFTGDIIDHGVWETSIDGNVESINKSYFQIYNTFKNIPVYPILGNHEPHPLNL